MNILGISGFYHDAAATIVQEGEIMSAAQEERFTRVKHDARFPANAIRFCLDRQHISLQELDAVAFYDKPFLKFERLLETYYAFAPKGWISFVNAMPVWLKEKIFLKKVLLDGLEEIQRFDRKKIKLLFPEHHLSHAASAYYPSPFKQAAILVMDGVGEWATASIAFGEGKDIRILQELKFPHSLGLLYSAFTYYCGFKVNSGEYKLMGLAPYGNPASAEVSRFVDIIRKHLVQVKEDGSLFLNQSYFSYATSLRMVPDKKWERLFGFPARKEEEKIEQHHCDLAYAIQSVTEEVVIGMARQARKLTGAEHLCMAGGVALNSVANGRLQREKVFKEIFVQPAAGDAGASAGAALAAHYIYFGKERITYPGADGMKGAYLGPEFGSEDIQRMAEQYDAPCDFYEDFDTLAARTAALLSEGKVIGWFQGRMEFGPRALGARSILADPRGDEMQKKVNLKIKFREGFRPFAPAVREEDKEEYFEMQSASPYMLFVHPVKNAKRLPLPGNFPSLTMSEKLYFRRSEIQAVTHVDYSARVQTVNRNTNDRFYKLLTSFKSLTGCGVLLNTSFNVRGEPIVCTPQEAYQCFIRTEIDYLVAGNFLFDKSRQPSWKEAGSPETLFTSD